jgi:hypothetical protein
VFQAYNVGVFYFMIFKAWLKRQARGLLGFCLGSAAVILLLILGNSGLGNEPFSRIMAALIVGCLIGPIVFLIYRFVRFAAH